MYIKIPEISGRRIQYSYTLLIIVKNKKKWALEQNSDNTKSKNLSETTGKSE